MEAQRVFIPVHGTFKLKSGEFLFNPKTGMAEGEILVDATTGESGNAARDKRMQDEVLESNRYPAIFYHPTEIKGPFKAGEGDAGPDSGKAPSTFTERIIPWSCR